ncbi:hypothetical protein F2Q69_00059288 [Brassica cretica]|uniref:Uncharacterized protein n=1 Tax=Brassica cretica TaxID=69181 RepID=A0A8S9RG87_BRACR|nr:hypothetical protein F2Q69_00059288 [Brassica cretica]
MFDPEDIFLCHGITERRVFSSRMAFGSSRMYVSVFFRIIRKVTGIQVNAPDFVVLCILCGIRRTFKILVLDIGCFARVLFRRILSQSSRPVEWSCEVKSSSVNSCGSARIGRPENIFLNSSSVVALANALVAETSAVGVVCLSLLPPLRGVCKLFESSDVMSDRAFGGCELD